MLDTGAETHTATTTAVRTTSTTISSTKSGGGIVDTIKLETLLLLPTFVLLFFSRPGSSCALHAGIYSLDFGCHYTHTHTGTFIGSMI